MAVETLVSDVVAQPQTAASTENLLRKFSCTCAHGAITHTLQQEGSTGVSPWGGPGGSSKTNNKIPRPDGRGILWPTRQLTCASRTIPYTLRCSRRARSASLAIRPDTGLIVTVPACYSQGQLSQLLHRHRSWILRHLDRFAAAASRLPKRWPYGPTLPYRGEEHLVALRTMQEPTVRVTLDRQLLVGLPRPGIDPARRLLKRWYVEQAARRLLERTTALGRQLQIDWRRVRVGDQRSRWGSCSAAGHLNFNYRLVMAPALVMDYVIIHELLHRRELNHSRRFWTLVASHCPDYHTSLHWLKTYGPYLGV